jgi:SNF family Na+-dependent transporter
MITYGAYLPANISLPWAAAVIGIVDTLVAILTGLAILLSFNLWGDFRPLGMLLFFADKALSDVMDFLVANIMLPLNALLIALFAGWMMSRKSMLEELA